MRIAVASGKGGTGKTTIAVSLALALSDAGPVQLLDCDVEEPNDHLFLGPEFRETRSVEKLVPCIDETRCTHCGACIRACEFHALARLGGHILVYSEMCHGCGRCGLVCPASCITEVAHPLGTVELGVARGLLFGRGTLHVGEAMATPIIHSLKEAIDPQRTIVLDAPPGTACPTIATLHGADVALLVTEPTRFGLHDLRAAVGVARALDVPVAVVVNRAGVGDAGIGAYCKQEGISILLTVPFERRIAASYAVGVPLYDELPAWREQLADVGRRLREVAR